MAHVVTAAAVVVRDLDGKLRYYYRGAQLPSAELDDTEVEELAARGMLTTVEVAEPDSAQDTDEDESGEGFAGESTGGADGQPDVPDAEATVPVELPAQVAPKAAWVDYAVAQGADRGQADAMTKQELIATYGG